MTDNEILKRLDDCDLDKDRQFVVDSLKARFVEDVCQALKENSITEGELASRLGKSKAYVSRLLNEKVDFSLGALADIGIALDMDVSLRLLKKQSN